jgi:hypothetical protein
MRDSRGAVAAVAAADEGAVAADEEAVVAVECGAVAEAGAECAAAEGAADSAAARLLADFPEGEGQPLDRAEPVEDSKAAPAPEGTAVHHSVLPVEAARVAALQVAAVWVAEVAQVCNLAHDPRLARVQGERDRVSALASGLPLAPEERDPEWAPGNCRRLAREAPDQALAPGERDRELARGGRDRVLGPVSCRREGPARGPGMDSPAE